MTIGIGGAVKGTEAARRVPVKGQRAGGGFSRSNPEAGRRGAMYGHEAAQPQGGGFIPRGPLSLSRAPGVLP